MTEKERKREQHRRDDKRRRERDRPAVFNVNKIPANETSGASAKCKICGKPIWFAPEKLVPKPRLLRLNKDGSLHRHQDG